MTSPAPFPAPAPRLPDTVVRFSIRQRVEHVLVMTLFLLLAFTGFPQKFPGYAISHAVVEAVGGIAALRFIHRASGFAFGLLAAAHLGWAAWAVATGRERPSMVPSRQDFLDVVAQIRYDLRLVDQKPRFDRFDYREKFEYWGLVIGALVMTGTGLVLFAPLLFSSILPGQLIPAAKMAHSNEGLMAFLVVITWHIWNAHLAPDIFPFNPTIFTGRISRHHLKTHHAREYARLFPEEKE